MKTKLGHRGLSAVVALLLAFATEAGADTLEELIDKTGPLGGVITVEDKQFNNFLFLSNGISATKTVTVSDLSSIAVSDLLTASAVFPGTATVQPGPGLRFQDTGDLLNVSGSGDVIDFIFSYDVTVIGALNRITGSAIQAIQPGDVVVVGGGTVFVTMDTALSPTVFFNGVTTPYSDGIFASPLTSLTVGTNVVLFGGGAGTTADLNAFEQRYEQTLVPEPGTWFLLILGLGALALVKVGRRRIPDLSHRILVPATLALLALVSPQTSRAADDFGPFGPSVLYCFYECKPATNTRLVETTLLMLANQRPDVDASGAAIPFSRAHLVFLDGNERPLFRTFVDLSGNDLDELNVCHTIKANLATAAAPQAGIVQVSIQDGILGLPADGSVDPEKFEVGTGVVVWIKNVFGSFFVPPFPNADPDPFGPTGVVRSIAKTTCLPADPHVITADPVSIAAVPRAQVPPVLIERTADPIH